MLNAEIRRAGKPMPLRWGFWHINCMLDAAAAEGHRLIRVGTVTLTQHHRFEDPSDGEVLELQPGDILETWA